MCRECIAEIRPTRAPQCVICGDRLASALLLMGDGRCPHCRDCAPAFERAVSFGEYEDGLRGLVRLLKYERVTPVAGPLGGMLAQAIVELAPIAPESSPVLVPVPLHKSRRQARGFNQAELIAQAAVRRLPHRLKIASDALVRRRDTASQVGLSREERIENVRDAFCIMQPGSIRDREVLLVDDVMTTGTTLSECARVLKQAGAKRVFAATVARAFEGASLTAADPGGQEVIEAGDSAPV